MIFNYTFGEYEVEYTVHPTDNELAEMLEGIVIKNVAGIKIPLTKTELRISLLLVRTIDCMDALCNYLNEGGLMREYYSDDALEALSDLIEPGRYQYSFWR